MFTLTIEDSNGQVANRFSFDHGSYIIGRQEGCDVVLASASVSRQHARIFVDQGRCYVEDLGSANGVLVDGQRVVKQRDLGTASQLRVGEYYLYLEYTRPEQNRANVLQTLFISDENGSHKLVRINDGFAGEEFSLSESENTIGRTDDNFILLSDTSISRHHAKVMRQGDVYTVMDLGSSNGSRVNGKLLKMPHTLVPGDRVHFGNIEFVFVSGDTTINPADYAGAIGGNMALPIGITVAVLILMGLAVGAVIVFGIFSFKEQKEANDVPAATQTVESQVGDLLAAGKEKIERRDWLGAVASFDDVLALKPDSQEAMDLKAKASKEADAVQMLEEGERLLEKGRHEEARTTLLKIPEDSQAFERAQPTLRHISSTLAYNYRNEATRLSRSKKKEDWLEAHRKVVSSLELDPTDAESKKLVEAIESQLKSKKIPFTAFGAK